jgi:hypothetical protein
MAEVSLQYRFYVRGTSLDGEEQFFLDWLAESPEEALQFSLSVIPKSWTGGIEVLDEESLDTCEMPLIDYWKEPSI